MKSLVGGVFLLLSVFLLQVMCCGGCWKQEKDALIAMNSRLGNTMSWARNTNSNCCEWEGVECNTTTGRVTKLKLVPPYRDVYVSDPINPIGRWQPNYSDFVIFKDLKTLDLSNAEISNCTTTDQGLNYLEVLDLTANRFDNVIGILSCLDGLSSLKSLTLLRNWIEYNDAAVHSEAKFFQTALETISSKLLHLEVLDISVNKLSNEILPSLRGFTSLKELHLNAIGLDSDLHIQGLCATLKNLEILHISNNNFNDNDIGSALSGLSFLKSLYLEGSQITMRSIYNISKLRSLEILDISHNDFNDFNDIDIASALSDLPSLKTLYLRGMNIAQRSIHNISKLKTLEILDLSLNKLNFWNLENHGFGFAWPSSLQVLSLSQNGLSNNILSHLSGLPRLKSLDLSYNNLNNGSLDISGKNIFSSLNGLPRLKSLDLSYNNLNGSLDISGSTNLSRLEILNLDGNMINGSNLREWLRAFPSIRNLTLRYNVIPERTILEGGNLRYKEFKGTIRDGGFHGFSNLEYLALDGTQNIKNEFFKSIGDFTSLKVLSMQLCMLTGTLPIGDWSKLKKLEELDLSYNGFVGKLPSSFANMTSLRKLALSHNYFVGNIGPNLASFTSLEYLSFEGNQFEFPVSFTQFSNHSNLKFIYGNGNKVIIDSHSAMKTWIPKFQLQVLQLSSTTHAKSIPLPSFLLYQYNLTYVDFTGCSISGEFPNWLLENNTKMEALILDNCSFIGDFHLPSHPNLNMVSIDVSNNAITGQIFSSNISSVFPFLIHLKMSRNAIHGSIPYELTHLKYLEALDLSDNQLSGEIPYNFSGDGSRLSSLKYLLLDGNSLSGSIPSNLFNLSSIQCLDISYNNFIGKIPSQMKYSPQLVELSMSNNHFEGSISSELAELERLTYLDLSQNNLSGCVPSFVNSSVSFIHLSNNNLSCLSKNMFRERDPRGNSLVTLDLSNNVIINGIHDLIHDLTYTGLNILLLKGNHFTGNIPKQLCHLTNLNILDLSYNNFVGEIPSCLGKMPFENKDPGGLSFLFNGVIFTRRYAYYGFKKEKANFTSKKRSETYTTNVLIYMSGIDLSHNKLNGSIPSELGNLTRIRALNLSNNYFTGKIPATFSDLVQVESLDLSFNMLRGQIPAQLSDLTSLEVFSVAHNNLSGATPEWKGQFSTFDESSYEGNQFLCGPPLPKSCNPSGEAPSTLPNALNEEGDDDSWVDMYVFRVSFVVAYTSILLVIPTVLYINPYWRQAWFYYIGLLCMNCYYFIEDNMYKFF